MQRSSSKPLRIHEVAVRDGFQIEPHFIPTADKIALINALGRSGVAKIEATSFSSPKAIPALADAAEVMLGIERQPHVTYAALVPNARGAERALQCRVDELNIVMSASETHNLANLRLRREQSMAGFADILGLASGSAAVNASLSTAFGCPFEGTIADEAILELIADLVAIGITRITLCDTTGMANPAQVKRLCSLALTAWPDITFTAHFHNTRGMGLANVLGAMEAGITHFDASLGGLGGCPFAPGASGNVCTEDLVHMLHAMGHDTGVNLQSLLDCASQLPAMVGHAVPGQVLKAGKWDRQYPAPGSLGSVQQRLAGTICGTAS